MEITGFIWLPEIEDKLVAKHSVSREEAERRIYAKTRAR